MLEQITSVLLHDIYLQKLHIVRNYIVSPRGKEGKPSQKEENEMLHLL